MNTGVIKLSHFSVKEYLLSTRVQEYFGIDEKTSHLKISELSIAYLLQFDDDSLPLTMAIIDTMPLVRYAAEHWIDHVKSGGMDSAVLQLILRLLTSGSAALENWIRIYNIDADRSDMFNIESTFNLSMDKAKVCSALYYSSLAGMQEVVVNATGFQTRTGQDDG